MVNMVENADKPHANKRTPEEEARIRGYVRLLIFVFVLVVLWYAFDLADL